MLEKTIIDGSEYIAAKARGVEYTLMRLGDAWFVASHRLALGRNNSGGGKHYATLADVAAGCKAFGTAEDLVQSVFKTPIYAA